MLHEHALNRLFGKVRVDGLATERDFLEDLSEACDLEQG
jgi:hypothetical protein